MDSNRRLQLQRKNLIGLMENGAFKFTDGFFLYTSGQIGPYFIQSIDITKNGTNYREAINDLTELIKEDIGLENFDVISGGESRDWDFSNPVSTNLWSPHTKLYKNKPPIGAEMAGKRVLHIADLNNEGSSIRDSWVPQIQNSRGKITDVVFYVDRLEDGKDVVDELGLRSHALVPLDSNAWQFLLDKGCVSQKEYDSLVIRSDIGKDRWAETMLRKKTDLLKSYLEDPNSRDKALKVLRKGYPHMYEELTGKLESISYRGGFE